MSSRPSSRVSLRKASAANSAGPLGKWKGSAKHLVRVRARARARVRVYGRFRV